MAPEDPLDFLFSLERLGMKFGLANMRALCRALGHPERSFAAVLVAGTNGKGSVTAMVEAALRGAGHRAARYTSPHLERLEERFVIEGAEVDTATLSASAARVRDAARCLVAEGTLEALPTFFECTTAVAFDLFREAGVALAVLEVGLGGRLDATNVVSPVAAAITSIDFDHQAQLGDTLEAIAREKAGVMRAGIPVVIGALPPPAAQAVAEAAAATGATLVEAADAARLEILGDDGCVTLKLRTGRGAIGPLTLGLAGRHQATNAGVAAALLEALDGLGHQVPLEAVRGALTGVRWPGRLERRVHGGAEVLIDAAHNPAGARALAAHLTRIGWTDATLVFGAMRDKDVGGMLSALSGSVASIVCTTPETPRARPALELAAAAAAAAPHLPVTAIDPPAAALDAACALSRRVVVAGSMFLIGPLRGILR